jgi:MFS superfamily sulfate permease-like transporter
VSRPARRETELPAVEAPLGLTEEGKPRRFTAETVKRDVPAGIITGLMAVPLTIGICLMSEYPIQIGLATVVAACLVSFVCYLVRPGNHVGVPGIAAGLAPVLALGVHRFGMQNMPWLIFLTSMMQMLVWKFRLEVYILKAVPKFLIEGLLAGVGLKIAMKFLPDTYAAGLQSEVFWSSGRLLVVACSVAALAAFVLLYRRFKETSPGLPYIAIIGGGAWLAAYVHVPMLHVEPVAIHFALPFPDFAKIAPLTHVEMVLYAAMLMVVDVIEQVMSNAAIEKIDPLGRKADSNNSLLVMWLGNTVSSLFGGMTNLDGLAKSSTNRMAGALTKMSCLVVAAVLGVVLAYPALLERLPAFSLAVLMIFTGWKMVAGLFHVAAQGKYELMLALFCGALVFRLGIFEGLLLCLALHSFIVYVVYRHEAMPRLEILRQFVALFVDDHHPHATGTLDVEKDLDSGGLRYRSITRTAADKKDLDAFIRDWAHGVDSHNLLSVVGCYDVAGLLWGTFAKELRNGHPQIKKYFEHLFELERLSVQFETGETRQYHDIFVRSGSYRFTYWKAGQRVSVPARYSFVCKKERTGWYILEHHSSQFPA